MTQAQIVWAYSIYEDGHIRLASGLWERLPDESDEFDMQSFAEACAEDDHHNFDGFERGDDRDIFLFKDGELHSKYTVFVDVEPVFDARKQ